MNLSTFVSISKMTGDKEKSKHNCSKFIIRSPREWHIKKCPKIVKKEKDFQVN